MDKYYSYYFFDEKKIFLFVILYELISVGLYFVHPLLAFFPTILALGIVFFYYAFMIGPLPWVFLMVIATGLDTWGRIVSGVTLFHVAWGMSIITVIYAMLSKSYRLQWNFPFSKNYFTYVLLASLSLIYSPNKLEGLQMIVITIALYILFVFIANFIKTRRDILVVFWSLLIANVFNAFLTFYQIAFQNVLYFGRGAVESTTGEKIWRAGGTFYDPNVLASFMIFGTILGVSLIIYSDLTKRHKSIIAFAVLVSIIGILATFSRSGWISLFVGFLIIMLVHERKIYIVYILSSFALLLAFFVIFTSYGGFIIERILSIFDIYKDISIRTRLGLMISSIKMFIDNPILGIGYRGFPILYPFYIDSITPTALLYVKESHTLYTLLLAELGIPGFLVVVLWFRKVLINSFNLIQSSQNQFLKAVYIGNFAVLISFLITYFFYGNLFPDFNLIWINFGMIYLVAYKGDELR